MSKFTSQKQSKFRYKNQCPAECGAKQFHLLYNPKNKMVYLKKLQNPIWEVSFLDKDKLKKINGKRTVTKNGYDVRNLTYPYDWGIWGKEWIKGALSSALFTYAVWDLSGKTCYVHNHGKSNYLYEFDIDLDKILD